MTPSQKRSKQVDSGPTQNKAQKRGEPPKRQVVEGARRADKDKAARCLVDWAIKNRNAVEDGKVKAKASRSPRARAKSPAK